jgi:hypothetical protein
MNQLHSPAWGQAWHRFANESEQEYLRNEAIKASRYDPQPTVIDFEDAQYETHTISTDEDLEEETESLGITTDPIERVYPNNKGYYKNFPRGPPFRLPVTFTNVNKKGDNIGNGTYLLHGTPFEAYDEEGKLEEKGITWHKVPSWEKVVVPGDIVWGGFRLIDVCDKSTSTTKTTAEPPRQKLFNLGIYGPGMKLLFRLGWCLGAGLGREMEGRLELVKPRRVLKGTGLGWTYKSPKNPSLVQVPEYFMRRTSILFIRSESDAIKFHEARTSKKDTSTTPDLEFFSDYVYGTPATSPYVPRKQPVSLPKTKEGRQKTCEGCDGSQDIENIQKNILSLGIDVQIPPCHVKEAIK